MDAPLDDDAEVDVVSSDIDWDAADVDKALLIDMIALDHLSGAAQTKSVSLWARASERVGNEPGCACVNSRGIALAIGNALENNTGVVGLALGPRLAVATPGAGVDIVVVVVACLELSSGRGDDKGTESEDGGESEAHDEVVGEERRGLTGWCSRV